MPAYYMRSDFRSHNKAGGNLVINSFHWEVDTLSSPPDFNSIANDLATHFLSPYSAVLGSLDHWDDVLVTNETYPGSIIGQGIHLVNVDGARAVSSQALSAGLCCLISRRTGTPRRWGRGRVFCPPAYGGNEVAGGGIWSSSGPYFIACSVLATSLQSGFSAGSTSYVPIIFSRGRAALNESPFTSVVTQCVAQPAQHFLRSRTTSP